MPTNLALGNRLDPAHRQIDTNSNDPNDPNRLRIIRPLVPKDNREDDAPHIPRRARAPRHDAVRMRMHVRHEPEDGAVGPLKEEGHPGHEAEHGALVVTVREADGDLEGAREDGVGVHEILLAPDPRAGIDCVREEAAEGSEGDVEEAEHGRPPAGARLAEGLEVLEVVGA